MGVFGVGRGFTMVRVVFVLFGWRVEYGVSSYCFSIRSVVGCRVSKVRVC